MVIHSTVIKTFHLKLKNVNFMVMLGENHPVSIVK